MSRLGAGLAAAFALLSAVAFAQNQDQSTLRHADTLRVKISAIAERGDALPAGRRRHVRRSPNPSSTGISRSRLPPFSRPGSSHPRSACSAQDAPSGEPRSISIACVGRWVRPAC